MKKFFISTILLLTVSMFVGATTNDEWFVATNNVENMKGTASWVSGKEQYNIPIDDVISLSYGKYFFENNVHFFRYYYQNSAAGKFTIQENSGAIIKSVKFTYGSTDANTYLAKYYYSGSLKANSDTLIKSGVTYAVDGNALTYYVGRTDNNSTHRPGVTAYEIRYFKPSQGVALTKNAYEIGWSLGLESGRKSGYRNIPFNNAITLHADQDGTWKYFSTNGGSLNCYKSCGPIDIIARKGVNIRYVKITYKAGDAVLSKTASSTGLQPSHYIASDSILYVNSDTLRLYVSSKASSYATLAITRIYVNYVDSNAIIEEFKNCKELKSEGTVDVVGVDSIYNWQLTNFSREASHHLFYDQTTQLMKGGKIAADNAEGGMKEVSFEWFSSDKENGVKFCVKAGADTINVVDSAKTGGYYPVTYTKVGVKKNGAFALEVAANSGAAVEVNHISIIPYLRFTMREDSVNAAEETTYDVSKILIDNTEDAANIVYTIESDGTNGAAISGSEVNLSGSKQNGAVVVKAAWEDVTAHFTLNVKVAGPGTGLDNVNVNVNVNRKAMVDGQLRIYRDGNIYNAQGVRL